MKTDDELRSLLELCEKTKPFSPTGPSQTWEEMSPEDRDRASYNIKFFVVARDAMPELIAEILSFRQELEQPA